MKKPQQFIKKYERRYQMKYMKTFCNKCNKEVKVNIKKALRTYTFKNEDIEIEDIISTCPICGEEVFNERYDPGIMDKINNIYRKRHSLLLPGEIRAIRKEYGLNQREFSRLLGLFDVEISRYEAGAIQSKEINDLILSFRKEKL